MHQTLVFSLFLLVAENFFCSWLREAAQATHQPPCVAWRWVDESRTVDGVQWPNMERNSESGPAAELWRFRLFGIESRWWWGRLRVFDGLATACPRWSTASNYSHQLCRRKTELRSRKANLGFSPCSLKATRWDIASPHIRSSLFGTCFTTPIYIYILPPKILCHIYIAEESIYIISPNVFIPRINPGLESAREIGPPTGLEGCRFVDLRRGDALVGKGRG